MSRLECCPKCFERNGRYFDKVRPVSVTTEGAGTSGFRYKCFKCGYTGPLGESVKEAKKLWNEDFMQAFLKGIDELCDRET